MSGRLSAIMILCAILVGQIVAGVGDDVRALTGGKEVRFLYLRNTGTTNGVDFFLNPGFQEKIYLFDTKTDEEVQVCPGGDCDSKNYAQPSFLADGYRFVITIGIEQKVYLTDIDGSQNTVIAQGYCSCVRNIDGVEWAYVRDTDDGSMSRYNVENPSVKEFVWDKTPVGGDYSNPANSDFKCCFFSVSGDGKFAVDNIPWPKMALFDLENQSYTQLNGVEACTPNMAPDDSHRWFFFNGDHESVFNYPGGADVSGGWNAPDGYVIWINPCVGGTPFDYVYELELGQPKYSANSKDYLTVHGPTKSTCQMHFGKYTEDYSNIEGWITITSGSENTYFGESFIDYPEQPGTSVAAPVIGPAETQFIESVAVTITSATEGAAVYFTIDGSDPSVSSTLYTDAFPLTSTATVRAIAIKDNVSSVIAEKTFTMVTLDPPVIDPAEGTFDDQVTVTITGPAGASIYYTLDTTDPDNTKTLYTAPFVLNAGRTVKARAVSDDGASSAVTAAQLNINYTTPPLTLTAPNGGEILSAGTAVTITWTADVGRVSGVMIYWSADNGRTWNQITEGAVTPGTEFWQAYPWTVPATVGESDTPSASSEVKIRIQDYWDAAMRDESDALMTVDIKGRPDAYNKGELSARMRMQVGNDALWGFAEGSATLSVYSVDGRCIESKVFKNAGTCARPSQKGVYTIRLHCAEGTIVRRLIAVE